MVNRDRDVAVAVAKMDMSNCVRKIIRIFIYIFYLEARTTSIWGSCFHYPDGRIIFKQKERSSAPTSLTLKISPTAVMTCQSSLSRRPSPSPWYGRRFPRRSPACLHVWHLPSGFFLPVLHQVPRLDLLESEGRKKPSLHKSLLGDKRLASSEQASNTVHLYIMRLDVTTKVSYDIFLRVSVFFHKKEKLQRFRRNSYLKFWKPDATSYEK